MFLAQQPSEDLKYIIFLCIPRVHPLFGTWLIATFLLGLVERLLGKLEQLVLRFLSKRT